MAERVSSPTDPSMHVLYGTLMLTLAALVSCSSPATPSPSNDDPSDGRAVDDPSPASEPDSSRSLDGGFMRDARRPDSVPLDAEVDARERDAARLADGASAAIEAGTTTMRAAPAMVQAPKVTGHIAGKASTTARVDLSKYGYVEQEFFVEGSASSFVSKGERGLDGKWRAERGTQASYKTRLLVRRPASAADFNGSVFVEWLNVTTGRDADIGFLFAWEELLRGGWAYVGVSVQADGIGSAPLLGIPADPPAPLKQENPTRYGSLTHPGDLYGYDIYAQAGVAVGWPSGVAPLADLRVERLLAYGQSQSAMRMITFANAVHPLTKVYDAFVIQSRAAWGAAVGDESNALLGDGTPVYVRDDLGRPTLQIFTETELFFPLGPTLNARQPDSDTERSWEIAGSAHVDQSVLRPDAGGCGAPINGGPLNLVVKAGIRAMHVWMKERIAPPKGALITVNDDKSAITRDEHGIALGGIRTPAVDAPVAANTGDPAGGSPLCLLYGSETPFSASKLRMLYPTHADYVSKVRSAAADAREKGFLLSEEEVTIVADAEKASVPP